jgi:hypothetical protein
VDERYNLDEILQAGSSDQLMAELMAVENAPVSEKPDAFLKELLAADQEELSTEEAERGGAFDGKKLQEITDLDGFETASAMNEAIYAEETLFQEQIGGPLVEAGAFDEEVLPISSVDLEPRDFLGTGEMWEAAEAGDADEAPGPEEVQPPLAAAPAVAGLSAPAAAEKAELPPAGPGEVREAVHGEGASEVLNLEDWQLLLAAAPVVVGVSAPAAVVAEKTESREKLTVRPEITLSPTEEIFTIKAMTSGHGVAVSLEEELILGFKPEQRLTVGFESTPAAQYPEYAAPVSDAAAGKTDLAELDRLLEESDLPLDTFMPVSERDAVSEPGEGSLIDLMARMEERLMSNMQAVLESKMHDIVHSVIKEELENLRQSCHQID